MHPSGQLVSRVKRLAAFLPTGRRSYSVHHGMVHTEDMVMPWLQHLRTRIVSASAQQLRHQSVFSDITSKLKQQVER